MKSKSSASHSTQYFSTKHLMDDLKGRSVRGGLLTLFTQVCKFLLNLIAIIVLARLLTPQDFGLFAMVATITNFVIIFKDLGLSMATIQREEISHEQVSTLFWVNVAFGVIMMLTVAALSPVIAWFYKDPRLIGITLLISTALFFSGLQVQHEALLRRQMHFRALTLVQVSAMAIGVVCAIVTALLGAGYWALIIQQIAQQGANMLGVWIACSWRPGSPVRGSGVRSMLAFGGNLTGFTLVNYFSRNLDNILIGWRWGALPLGLYDKAYQLLLLPMQQINNPIAAVATPALSRLITTPERYRSAYLRVLEKVSLLTMPSVAFMIATSDWLLQVFLGAQWVDASGIFAWLGFSAFVQPVGNSTGWLFMTQNRTREMFQWGIIGSFLSVVAIAAGLPWGPVGVAASYSVSGLFIRTPLLFWFIGRSGPIKTNDFYRTMFPFTVASILAMTGILFFRYVSGDINPALGLLISAAIDITVTLSALLLSSSGRKAIRDTKDSLLTFRSKVAKEKT